MTLRWGIVATGQISATFTEDLLRSPDADVVAVGSRRAETAHAFADRYGIGRAHASYDDLVDDPDVDVVYVGATNDHHHLVAGRALLNGKHVLCEKPLTLDAAQAEDLVALARRQRRLLMEAMWLRCNPGIRRLQALVADGAVGRVRHVSASLSHVPPAERRARYVRPDLGGGVLVDMGIYPLTLARLVLGWPSDVQACAVVDGGVDHATAMAATWSSGATASLSCSMLAQLPDDAVVVGEEGSVLLPAPFNCPDHLTLRRPGKDDERIDTPYEGHGYVPEIAEVTACVRDERVESPLVPHDETLRMMRLLDRLRGALRVAYPIPAPTAGH
jgi:predicted dehydrogenase